MQEYSSTAVRSLLRQFLRTARTFSNLNYRDYFTRRSIAHFRENKSVPAKDASALYTNAHKDLQALQRQAAVSAMYPLPKSVLEVQLQNDRKQAVAQLRKLRQ